MAIAETALETHLNFTEAENGCECLHYVVTVGVNLLVLYEIRARAAYYFLGGLFQAHNFLDKVGDKSEVIAELRDISLYESYLYTKITNNTA